MQGAAGKTSASKLKNTATAKAMATRYGIIVQPNWLKAQKVSSADRVRRVGGSTPCIAIIAFLFAHSHAYGCRLCAAVCVAAGEARDAV